MAILAIAATWVLGCGTRYARRSIADTPELTVTLRSELRDGEPVDRGYQHPTIIAPVRLAHILSQIDVRIGSDDAEDGQGGRKPVVPTNALYDMGAGIALALESAKPSEELVVQAVSKERRLGIFTASYLTSLVLYVHGDLLHIYPRHIHWEIPKGPDRDLPEPWIHRDAMAFRVIPGEGMFAVGPQEVAVQWRDPVFAKPRRLLVTQGGKLQRRTILMESTVEEEGAEEPPEHRGVLSPETLRKLADLEQARRDGAISEAQYHQQRREILSVDPGSR
jgi:hypothetical protein